MYDHTLQCLQITRSDMRPGVKRAVSLVIPDGHLIFLRRLRRYVWVNVLIVSSLSVAWSDISVISRQRFSSWASVADGRVVRAGISVTWNVLSWSRGHEFEQRLGRTWVVWYFCPESHLNQNYLVSLYCHVKSNTTRSGEIRTPWVNLNVSSAEDMTFYSASDNLPATHPLHRESEIHMTWKPVAR